MRREFFGASQRALPRLHGGSTHRAVSMVQMTPKRAAVVLVVAAVFLNISNARPAPKERDQTASCDWKQSGLAQSSGGVLPVYLDSCDTGTVRWSHPRGALRIVLRSTGRQHRQFQACFRLDSRSSGALVYLETAQNDLVPGPGVRAKCVLSRGGSVVVYAVASPGASSWEKNGNHQLTLTYTTGHPVASFERLEGWEECRPCTETELRERYCLSDLVAEATVRNATLDPDKGDVRWLLSVSRTHRERMPDYVTRPARCGFPRDMQEPRLVIARWHLGRPVVTCSPKLTQWQRLEAQGNLECSPEDDKARPSNT